MSLYSLMLAQNLWNVNQILPSLALKSSYPKCTSSSHIPGSAIRSRRHGRYRQPSSEIEMRSVRLICQTEHPSIMRHFYDGPQIAADSIIGRIVDQYRYRLRMLCDCLCHLLSLHSQRNSQPLVHLRIYIDRNRSAQYQGIFNTLRWTLRGRMISSPRLQAVSTILCTELVVPPTIRKACAAPNASAASSSASRMTDTGWHRLSSGFMLLTSTPTHCSPRNFVSSGLPRSFPVLHGSEPCADPYGYASRSYPIPPFVIKKCRSLFCHRINFLVYTKNRLRICTTCLSSQSVFLFLQNQHFLRKCHLLQNPTTHPCRMHSKALFSSLDFPLLLCIYFEKTFTHPVSQNRFILTLL